MLVRASTSPFAHETAGAARIRHSLRPLFSRANPVKTRALSTPRDCEGMSSMKHCAFRKICSGGRPRARPAARHSLRQWRTLRQSQCPVQSFKALGLVAQARNRHRTHQARSSAAEWPPRAHDTLAPAQSHARSSPPAAAARRPRRRCSLGHSPPVPESGPDPDAVAGAQPDRRRSHEPHDGLAARGRRCLGGPADQG